MNFFMIHLRNVKNAFENMFEVIFLLFSYKRKETLEENDWKKTYDMFDNLNVSDFILKELINQDQTVETDNRKITYQKQSKTNHLETVNSSFEVINNVIKEKVKSKQAPDPTLDVDFNAIDDNYTNEKYFYGAIKNRMFNYDATRNYWECISELKK